MWTMVGSWTWVLGGHLSDFCGVVGARPEGAKKTRRDKNSPPLFVFSFRSVSAGRPHSELCVSHTTQIILFSPLPNSKTCLRLFVLEKPEGMEPFAGTVLSKAARRDCPDNLPPAGGASGSVGTQPGLSLSSSCQGPVSWGESKSG